VLLVTPAPLARAPRILFVTTAPRMLGLAPGMLLAPLFRATTAPRVLHAATLGAATAPHALALPLPPLGPVAILALRAAPALVAASFLGLCRGRSDPPEAPDSHATGQDHRSPERSHDVCSLI